MKNIEDKKIKELFSKMKQESPSMSFERILMKNIYAEHLKIVKRKNRIPFLYMLSGALALIILPFIIFYFFYRSILDIVYSQTIHFIDSMGQLTINPMILSIFIVCLLLLVVDSSLRKHLWKKDKEHKTHG